jgi:hypothetical protein
MSFLVAVLPAWPRSTVWVDWGVRLEVDAFLKS